MTYELARALVSESSSLFRCQIHNGLHEPDTKARLYCLGPIYLYSRLSSVDLARSRLVLYISLAGLQHRFWRHPKYRRLEAFYRACRVDRPMERLQSYMLSLYLYDGVLAY